MTRPGPAQGPRRVEIGNPGAMHFSYALVAAVQALGYAGDFHTAFYYRPRDWAAILPLLPPGPRRRLLRQLERRRHAGLDPARVRLAPWREAARLLGGRLGLGEDAAERLLQARNLAADRRLARLVRRAPPAAVIAHDTAALETLTAAAEAGCLGILNQVIGHRVAGERILQAEAARHPAFAAGLGHRDDAALTERCRREALAAGHVIAPSDYVRDTLLAIGVPAERIAVVPFGVDVERFRPAPGPRPPGPLRLLFVGQLAARKGLAYLLEALRRLPPGLCRATLVGPLAVPRAALAPYAGLFEHRAALPYHEVHAAFAAADLFVYPSLHEGSALAIYEALASGLPVVATPNSGSVVRDGVEGLLVPPGDATALAGALLSLAEDAPRRAAMAAAARARALEHTWMHYEQRLGALLRRLVGPP